MNSCTYQADGIRPRIYQRLVCEDWIRPNEHHVAPGPVPQAMLCPRIGIERSGFEISVMLKQVCLGRAAYIRKRSKKVSARRSIVSIHTVCTPDNELVFLLQTCILTHQDVLAQRLDLRCIANAAKKACHGHRTWCCICLQVLPTAVNASAENPYAVDGQYQGFLCHGGYLQANSCRATSPINCHGIMRLWSRGRVVWGSW